MSVRSPIRTILLALVSLSAWGEDVEERIKATDMSDPEAVFELAQWCTENGQVAKSRKYYNVVIQLDKEHEGAREALGQVRMGDRWVSSKFLDDKATAPDPAAGGKGVARKAGGPGPTAAQVEWDLTPPKDPKPDFTWIDQYVSRMSSVANDSREMDVSVATMLADEHVDVAIPRLCKALLDTGYRDIYGGSMIAMELVRKGRFKDAKRLLPFLVTASSRVTDPEDLYTFAFSIGALKDKRVVPRLTELLGEANEEIQEGARDGLAQITMMPRDSITVESAKAWWDRNHTVSDQQIYQEQLRSNDARVSVEAAKALYEFRDRDIVPVLAGLMQSEDMSVRSEAISVLKMITSTEWTKVEDPPEKRKDNAKRLVEWWKENQFRHVWPEDAGKVAQAAAAAPTDPAEEWVKKLGSVTGNEAAQSESSLVSAGDKSIPALVIGLSDGSRLVRRKCQEILVKITRENIPYDAGGSDEERRDQIAAWTDWLTKNGKLGPGDGDEVVEDDEGK